MKLVDLIRIIDGNEAVVITEENADGDEKAEPIFKGKMCEYNPPLQDAMKYDVRWYSRSRYSTESRITVV